MHRLIVQTGADVAFLHGRHEGIAIQPCRLGVDARGIEMPGVPVGKGGRLRQGQCRPIRQLLLVGLCQQGAFMDELVELRQLMYAQCRLHVHHVVFKTGQNDLVVLAAFFAKPVPGLPIHAVEAQQG